MVHKRLLLTIYFALSCLINCLCASTFSLPQVTTFYKHQYNASNRNWCIDHGKDGYIYVGNDQGLLSFDGVNWTLNELPARSKLRSVCVADDGLVYTGSSEEIGFWQHNDSGELFYSSLNDKLVDVTFHNQEIWRIFEDADNNIIFQGFSLTLKYNGQTVEKVEVDNPPNLMVEHDDRLWGSTRRGVLLELTSYGYKQVMHSPKLRQKRLRGILPYQGDKALIVTRKNGLFVWQNKDIRPWQCEANTILKQEDINCAVHYKGYYFIGTINSGIFIINTEGKILYQINSQNHLQDNTILSLKFDEFDRLWFTMSVGLGYLELNSPIKFLIDSKKSIGAVHSVAYNQGNLYLATNKGIIYKPFSKGERLSSFEGFKMIPELTGLAWSLKVVDNQLLCGHNRGVFLIEVDRVTKISNIAGARSFQNIKVKGEDYLIHNTYTELAVLEKDEAGKWQFKTTVQGFSEPTMEVAVDHKNQIWVQHDRKSELYNIRLQQNLRDAYSYNMYKADNGLPQDMKSEVFEFEKRIVITSSDGIYTYDELKDSIVYYKQLNQKIGEYRKSHRIIRHDKNQYWFIKDRQLALFQFGEDEAKIVVQYHFVDPHMGLVEDFENIVTVDSIGTFMGMENGIGMIYSDDLEKLMQSIPNIKHDVKLKLTYTVGEQVMQKSELFDEKIELPFRHKDFVLNVVSLVSPGHQLNYNFKLLSPNDTIVLNGQTGEFSLQNLPVGINTIHVQAFDRWGQPTVTKVLTVNIVKPWYHRTAFIILFALIGLFLLSATVLRFKRNLKHYTSGILSNTFADDKQWDIDIDELKDIRKQLEEEVSLQNNHIATGALNTIRNKEVLSSIKKELTTQKEKLGIRYPDKYYKKLVSLIDSNIHTEDDWAMFEQHFDKANGNFVSRLKGEYPQLTPRDLRLCAYLKMNLSSKEIAPLLDISERSVEVHRYRLRKKLELPPEDNLSEFMIGF